MHAHVHVHVHVHVHSPHELPRAHGARRQPHRIRCPCQSLAHRAPRSPPSLTRPSRPLQLSPPSAPSPKSGVAPAASFAPAGLWIQSARTTARVISGGTRAAGPGTRSHRRAPPWIPLRIPLTTPSRILLRIPRRASRRPFPTRSLRGQPRCGSGLQTRSACNPHTDKHLHAP